MRILITGATGRLGRQVVDELAGAFELRLIARRPGAGGGEWIAADLAEPGDWARAFAGVDVVVHLAGNADPRAQWGEVARQNLDATRNVLEAAVEHGVRRVVYASSRHVVLALEEELAPACYAPAGPKIGSDAAPRPVSPYGVSKAFGEILGRAAVDAGRLPCFLAVRIGTHHPAPPPSDEALLRRWIGPQDLRALFRRCVEAAVEGFHVVYGVSAQPTSPYDLSHTRRILAWEPRQLPPAPIPASP